MRCGAVRCCAVLCCDAFCCAPAASAPLCCTVLTWLCCCRRRPLNCSHPCEGIDFCREGCTVLYCTVVVLHCSKLTWPWAPTPRRASTSAVRACACAAPATGPSPTPSRPPHSTVPDTSAAWRSRWVGEQGWNGVGGGSRRRRQGWGRVDWQPAVHVAVAQLCTTDANLKCVAPTYPCLLPLLPLPPPLLLAVGRHP